MSWDIFSKSKIQYFLQKLKGIFDKKVETSNLAEPNATETTTTATKAHAKDSKFYLAATQQYCMASTNIAIGDTLVENTNYVEITINGFLTDMEYYLKMAGQVLETKVDKETGKGLSHNDFVANNTVLSTDKTPYLNRQCLTPTGFSSYVREKLIGCSVAWNQLVQNGDFSNGTNNWSLTRCTGSVSNNVLTVNPTENDPYIRQQYASQLILGHVYILTCTVNKAIKALFANGISNLSIGTNFIISKIGSSAYNEFVDFRPLSTSDTSSWTIKGIQLIDLTLAFGSSVADTLYAMTNNGGIDWLRNHNYPIDQYTQYGYGLYSSKPSAKKCIFKNLVDWQDFVIGSISGTGEDNNASTTRLRSPFIRVAPNTTYAFSTSNSLLVFEVHEYVAEGNWIKYTGINATSGTLTTSANTNLIKVLIRKSDNATIQVNENNTFQAEKGSQATAYTPYAPITYSLGSTELRGHLIVQNGEIVAEGDVRESNGGITRKYGIVDLGTLTWTYNSSYGFFSNSAPTGIKAPSSTSEVAKIICAKYVGASQDNVVGGTKKSICVINNPAGLLAICTDETTDATTFKNSLNGVYLVYELATPTTETSSPFADPMSLNGCTTEEYVDDRTIPVPVGHETQYMGQSSDIIPLPSSPHSDGVSMLMCASSGGKEQFYWDSSFLQAFQVGCDEIVQAVTAKYQVPASNSPDDISAAINRIPALTPNCSVVLRTMTSDVSSFTVPYDSSKTIVMVMVIPVVLTGVAYEMTFLVGKLNLVKLTFEYVGSAINYNTTDDLIQTGSNTGSMSFDSTNNLITINSKSGNYRWKNNDTFMVAIVYYPQSS